LKSGIRVTTPARTLVDLADVLTPKQLTRAVNEAQVQRPSFPPSASPTSASSITKPLRAHRL
jgi:hypothetical protein